MPTNHLGRAVHPPGDRRAAGADVDMGVDVGEESE